GTRNSRGRRVPSERRTLAAVRRGSCRRRVILNDAAAAASPPPWLTRGRAPTGPPRGCALPSWRDLPRRVRGGLGARKPGWRVPGIDARLHPVRGRIHPLRTGDQVALVANSIYRGQRDLVLLVIDPHRVQPEIRYE